MGFGKKINPNQYPKRRWSIVASSGDGKSLFGMQMEKPLAIVDADNQIDEAVFVSGVEDAFVIAEEGKEYEMRDVDAIERILRANMKGTKVGTIMVDSITPIVKRIVTGLQHEPGNTKVSDYKAKSEAMQILGDVITSWNTDVLFVYHYHTSYDNQGNEQESTTVTELELIRLQKHLNAKLEIVRDGERRGIKILWSRAGRSGQTLWDNTGLWLGMPEKIEASMYDGLTTQEKEVIAKSNGEWSSSADAIAWGVEAGGFDEVEGHAGQTSKAKNSFKKMYLELKAELGDELTQEVAFAAWKDKVQEKINKE